VQGLLGGYQFDISRLFGNKDSSKNLEVGVAGRTVEGAHNVNASAYGGLIFSIHGDMLSNQGIWSNLIHSKIKN